MTVNLDICSITSDDAAEIYITALPEKNLLVQEQLEGVFSAIREHLDSKGAKILQEKIFGTQSVFEAASQTRSKAYGDLDDEVSPSLLVCEEGLCGPFAGVQVHAVVCQSGPEVITLDQTKCGRILHLPGRKFLTLSAISAPKLTTPIEQARAMLEMGEAAIRQFGSDFLCVPRTWMWLGDILSWYDDFNDVRNKFFIERNLLGQGSRQLMPASTGIGLAPVDRSSCSMDLTAILEPTDSIQYLQVTGKQQCAFDYGSAFSRASRATTPAGETVYVSGTASIDESGATTNIDDPLAQIKATIENVRAVLKDMNCKDADVVQGMAYCKTTEVEEIYNSLAEQLPWPLVPMICDVCRCDLLFEIEVTAMARK